MSSGYLYRVFRATETLNRREILRLAPACPGGTLLDCGCGDGAFTAELAGRIGASTMLGIEAVPERIAAARSRGVLVEQTDLNGALPFPDASADLVHANQVIEHLHSTDRFLRELRRIVKPTGHVVLSTNNLASWHNIVSLLLGFQPMPMHVSEEVIAGNPLDPLRGEQHQATEDSHLRIFSFQGLKELCIHHGFVVHRLVTAGYYPFPPRLARILTRVDRRHGAFLIAVLHRGQE